MTHDPQYHLGRIAMAGAYVIGSRGDRWAQDLLGKALREFIASPAVDRAIVQDLREAMKK